MSLRLVERPDENLTVHVIPVPVGMTAEGSWSLIKRGALLVHPLGEPSWAAIFIDEDEGFIEEIR